MSLQYWGYCIYCHHPMKRFDYPDEIAFVCLEHVYSQHFKKQPDAWDGLRREKFWRILEILGEGYREVLIDYASMKFVLVKMGLLPSDVLKPREDWDYFFWRDQEINHMKGVRI